MSDLRPNALPQAHRARKYLVSDAQLKAASGLTRTQWFAALDDVGAHSWPAARIARWLGGKGEVDGWWARALTQDYLDEREYMDHIEAGLYSEQDMEDAAAEEDESVDSTRDRPLNFDDPAYPAPQDSSAPSDHFAFTDTSENDAGDETFSITVSHLIAAKSQVIWPLVDDDDLRRMWLDVEFGVRGRKENETGYLLDLETAVGSKVSIRVRTIDSLPDGTQRSRVIVKHAGLASDGEARETRAFWHAALDDLEDAVFADSDESADSHEATD
ncbi:MAG: hypothetical protein SPI12_00640 [Actinomycetaceae bacterium]|nr:hypothetical protein [Actinomycetaceae bacterium]MDY6082358.1 hypothetical protein [Actinomycetaceae bacterium]